MDKLILFFKAKSFFHLFIVFIIFGISGSLSVFISGPLINYLNIESLIPYYPLYLIIRILIIFPIYQFVLIVIGTLFGQYKYFLEFEKKIFKRLKIF